MEEQVNCEPFEEVCTGVEAVQADEALRADEVDVSVLRRVLFGSDAQANLLTHGGQPALAEKTGIKKEVRHPATHELQDVEEFEGVLVQVGGKTWVYHPSYRAPRNPYSLDPDQAKNYFKLERMGESRVDGEWVVNERDLDVFNGKSLSQVDAQPSFCSPPDLCVEE